jgi:hypothetical protein
MTMKLKVVRMRLDINLPLWTVARMQLDIDLPLWYKTARVRPASLGAECHDQSNEDASKHPTILRWNAQSFQDIQYPILSRLICSSRPSYAGSI